MQTFFNKTNIYDDLQSVLSISEWLRAIAGELVVDATVSSLGYSKFFHQLEEFELSRAGKRTQTINIQAKSLPYAAWVETRGKGRYLQILVSERYYSEEPIVYEDFWKSDRFQNKVTGRLCKADDPQARRIVKAGDLRKTWTSHFSLKSRLFTADGYARKRSTRKERIGFDRLLSHIRQCIAAAFVKLKIQFNKAFLLPKLKRHDWLNKYQNINLTRINSAIQHIEQELQMEWIALRDGYFLQEEKVYDRFMALAKRYANKMKQGFSNHPIDGGRKKIKLSFSIFMNVIRVQENIDTVIEDFDKEIEEFRMKYRYGI